MTIQNDPFSSVRISSKKTQEPIQQEQQFLEQTIQQENQSEDPFASVRLKKMESHPEIFETGRHATRIGSRIAETIGGIPGDVGSLIQSGVFAGLEKLTGIPATEEAREKAKGYRAPTSKELKKMSIEATGGYTKPQSKAEEIGDELAETVASLVGPMKFRKVLGVSIGSQAAKEGIKLLGGGETSQEAGKLGTMFLLSMLNPGGALKYAESQYDKADILSKGASISAKNLENNLYNLRSDLQKGVSTSNKSSVLKPIEEILPKIKNGKIRVDELTSAKRDINNLMGEPSTLTGARKLLNGLGKEIDNAIKPYEKINPQFGKVYRPANEIYGAVKQGNKASNFIKKTLGAKSVLGAAIAETALGHPEYIIPTIATALGSLGAAKTVDFMTRVAKSKELQKFYSKAITAALAEDASALRLYEDKIEEYLIKNQ